MAKAKSISSAEGLFVCTKGAMKQAVFGFEKNLYCRFRHLSVCQRAIKHWVILVASFDFSLC